MRQSDFSSVNLVALVVLSYRAQHVFDTFNFRWSVSPLFSLKLIGKAFDLGFLFRDMISEKIVKLFRDFFFVLVQGLSYLFIVVSVDGSR